MADPDDPDLIAGEFVLGTLPPEERRAFLRRLARDEDAANAVAWWQERLAPLGLSLAPVDPPTSLYPRIERSIEGTRAANDNGLWRWRVATAAAAAIALVLGGLALRPGGIAPAPQPSPRAVQPVMLAGGMAALSEEGTTPALVITYNQATRRLKMIPVNMPNDTLHSFQLWSIEGKTAPKPLGLIDPRGAAQEGPRIERAQDLVFAVSQEPLGGSKTGFPTGKIMWSGKLVTVPAS